MDLFSISQLSKYAGIKPHTIRIWEQRYDALKPVRSEGNTRYYDGEQLRRLLNIVSLKDQESSLSILCGYSNEELYEKVQDNLLPRLGRGDQTEYFITQFIASGISYDEHHFNKISDAVLSAYKPEVAYTKVFYPLLVRVGIFWSINKINAPIEHFISNMLRQKFYVLINDVPVPKKTSQKWLLFLREGEFHELGLLFASYLIKSSRRSVVYLGADTPLEPLLQSVEIIKPTHLLFFQVATEEDSVLEEYIFDLSSKLKQKILVATAMKPIHVRKKVQYLHSLADLQNILLREA